MGVLVELWVRDIAENIYPDNSFYNQSRNDSAFQEGSKVHLPQAGTAPATEKNRTVLPATAAKRNDTSVSYDLPEFTTDPVIIQNTEEIETSYDKRQSVMFDHYDSLKTRLADEFAYEWGASLASNIFRTTGGSRSAYKSGQTGNRKAVAKNDFIEAQRLLDRMDIPQEGRIALVDADLMADIMKIEEFVSLEKIGNAALAKGAVGQLLGFDIFKRSRTVMYDNQSTPVRQAVGTAIGTDHNASILFWHIMFVRRSLGSLDNNGIEIFIDEQSPLYYGDVISAMVHAGGRKARSDEKGVVTLVEEATA